MIYLYIKQDVEGHLVFLWQKHGRYAKLKDKEYMDENEEA